MLGLVFVSRDFEVGTNVSCEELTISPPYGAIFFGWSKCMLRCHCEVSFCCLAKGNKERKSICIAPFVLCIVSKRSDIDHTVWPANTPCLPFFHKRSPDGATSNWGSRYPIAAYSSWINIYQPEMDERLSWPGWSIYSGRFTHGHPSASDRVQDREFVGQRPTFYRCATQPTPKPFPVSEKHVSWIW